MDTFEVATRSKFRFPFKGLISVEDLWDLSVENLDNIYKVLNSQLKQAQEESLLNTRSKTDKELDVRIEIVKHIVSVKLEENAERLKAKERREQKQKIMEILQNKKETALQGKSEAELQAMLDELDK
jgi:tryptophanase